MASSILELRPTDRMSVEDVLEGLAPKVREKLLEALTTRVPGTKRHAYTAREIARACKSDGYEITTRQVEYWRSTHVST